MGDFPGGSRQTEGDRRISCFYFLHYTNPDATMTASDEAPRAGAAGGETKDGERDSDTAAGAAG
ncbi:MAG: hypothetical protein M3Y58_04750 [Chloroflexota bacterium]|nr:hypothetical protein [Chloroflexota bacterium]